MGCLVESSADPEKHLVEWIRKGVPLGMSKEIPCCGILPMADDPDGHGGFERRLLPSAGPSRRAPKLLEPRAASIRNPHVGRDVVWLQRCTTSHGKDCSLSGANLAVAHSSIGDAKSAIHGRSNVDSSWADLLTEQEPGAFAVYSTSLRHQPGMA